MLLEGIGLNALHQPSTPVVRMKARRFTRVSAEGGVFGSVVSMTSLSSLTGKPMLTRRRFCYSVPALLALPAEGAPDNPGILVTPAQADRIRQKLEGDAALQQAKATVRQNAAVEETPAGRHATAAIDAAGVPGAVGLAYHRAGGVWGGVGVRRRQDARDHERSGNGLG